ncbi:MAG: GAF domain-containing protein, partial [Planctomycetia bacterium]|nr:GAF domain-containing protein [Planctomycetia bacterium]
LGAVGAERGSLLSWDAEAKRLSLEVAYGVPKELAAEMAGGEHAIAKIGARTGEPILVGIDDADVKHEHPERYKTGSFLCMPMSVDSEGGRRKTVGVICVTSKLGSEPISTDDLKVLEPLARELASVYAAALQRERFHEMAYTDYETGLGNLRFFSTYLKSLLEQARAQEGEVGLFLVKADHRIFVNNVAIRPSTREMQQIGRAMGDLSDAGVRVARLKENLFAVTLWRAPGTSRIESGDPFADFVLKIQAVVRERKLPLTVSVGYNVFPIYADDAMQFVAGAREALGRALPRGPGSVAGPR